jgi:hypothetical protein
MLYNLYLTIANSSLISISKPLKNTLELERFFLSFGYILLWISFFFLIIVFFTKTKLGAKIKNTFWNDF